SPKQKSCAPFAPTAKRSVLRRSPLPRKAKKGKRRGVVDASVVVASISSFKDTYTLSRNPSADLLRKWAEEPTFVWLVSEDILNKDKEVLRRLRMRSHVIGRVVNLIRERAEEVKVRTSTGISPDPGDDPFCLCAEQGRADFVVTLNPKDFP